jgi:hypothetical protein
MLVPARATPDPRRSAAIEINAATTMMMKTMMMKTMMMTRTMTRTMTTSVGWRCCAP